MHSELSRAVSELRTALGRAENVDDVKFLCGVAAHLERELDTPLRSAQSTLATSMARLDRLRKKAL